MERSGIFGVRVDYGEREEMALAALTRLSVGGRIYTVNPLMLMYARRHPVFAAVLNRSTYNFPDGHGVCGTLKSRGARAETLPGVELGELLLSAGAMRVAFLGGRRGVARRAFRNLAAKYPGLVPVFLQDGYRYREDRVGEKLEKSAPDLCFVCLGSPKQEILIDRLSHYSPRTLFVGLGGSLDVYAGKKRRAPAFFRRHGAEWLWRMGREPLRFLKLPTLFRYFFLSRAEGVMLWTKKAGEDRSF